MEINKIIVFVCTSNTCRSPMAEGLARKYLKDNSLDGKYTVISRGLTDMYEPIGSQASNHGIHVMINDYNIDVSNHRSKLLNDIDMNDSYIVIAVSQSHYNEIIKRYPNNINKVSKLSEDVMDPWHENVDVYQKTAFKLSNLINDIMTKIII